MKSITIISTTTELRLLRALNRRQSTPDGRCRFINRLDISVLLNPSPKDRIRRAMFSICPTNSPPYPMDAARSSSAKIFRIVP